MIHKLDFLELGCVYVNVILKLLNQLCQRYGICEQSYF